MNGVLSLKKEARAFFRSKRAGLSEKERHSLDASLCQRIICTEAYADSDVVLLYYPIKNEPDLLAVARHALSKGKRVAFPVSDTESFTLGFYFIRDLSELVPGAYSIPEPSKDAERFCVGEGERALCIVPALSYDRNGFRIGYGRGFYDRFLAEFDGVSLGAAYSDFLVDSLPGENTDVSVDVIITEKEEIFTDGKQRKSEQALEKQNIW